MSQEWTGLIWLLFGSERACLADSQPPDQSHDDYSCRWNRNGPEFVGHLAQEAEVTRRGFSTQRYLSAINPSCSS